MARSGIYFITNVLNNKTYVGSSVNIDKRWKEHKGQLKKQKHKNLHLQSSWTKYGEENFEFKIAEEVPKEQLLTVEQQYLDVVKLMPSCYYNVAYSSTAPTLGRKLSKETCDKISKANKGKVMSAEARMNCSKAQTGLVRSEEFKAKVSAGMKAYRLKDKELNGANSAHIVKLSDETKDKISQNSKAMWENPEYRANITQHIKARWENPEYRANIAQHNKATWNNNPELRANQSKRGKAMWDNPEYKAKMTAMAKGNKSRTGMKNNPESTAKMVKTQKENRLKKKEAQALELAKATPTIYPTPHIGTHVGGFLGLIIPSATCNIEYQQQF